MDNSLKITFLALALTSAGSMAECTQPEAPNLPDGARSTMEDMLEGQKAVKTFQTANVAYMDCLEKAFTAAEAAAEEGTDEEKQAAQATYTETVDAYNAAVSKEEEVAGEFNTQIKAYKKANPK